MPVPTVRTLSIMGLLLLAFAPVEAALAEANFAGAGQHTSLDCGGEAVHVQGADNHLVIRGACTSLIVEGASNEITIDLAPQSSIRVMGASNRIAWKAPGQAKPKLNIAGADNQVYRAK